MEVSVLNIKGEDTGKKVVLNDAIFGIEPNDHCIYLAVNQYLAAQRQGTHKSKERSEIAGSTRKLIRQKGGGGARRGDIKSPVLRGGGRVFGPRPRDYWFKLNKKVKALARKSALSYKAQQNAIVVVEDFDFEAPKTKEGVCLLNNLKVEGKKTLIVLPEVKKNVNLSVRNIQRVEVMTASALNTYKVMNANVLVMTENALKLVDETFIKYGGKDMAYIVKPLVTEKMTAISEKQNNKFGFIVLPSANKIEIKKEIEAKYNVNVVSVITMNYAGKRKSRYTKAGVIKGRTKAFKKAIVTLKEGETIDFYSNI